MNTMDKLDLLRALATRNYARCTKAELIETWAVVGDYELEGNYPKDRLIEIIIEAEIQEQITEPGLTEGWANQVDYYLENMLSDMTLDEKAKYIASGLVREEWREGL
jgi:hypothetical protein